MSIRTFIFTLLTCFLLVLSSCSNQEIFIDESENWTVKILVSTQGNFEEQFDILYTNEETELSEVSVDFLTISGSKGNYTPDILEGERHFTLTRNSDSASEIYDEYKIEMSWKTDAGEEFVEILTPKLR